MMRRRTQNRTPIPFLDLAMLAVVAGFFTYSSYTFWNGKPRPPVATAAPAPSRALATISSPAAPVPERSTYTLEIDCLGAGVKPFRTQANLLRVEGKLCGHSKKVGGRNLTTQEEMQIFLRSGKFTSHYFPLSVGTNRIVLDDLSAKNVKSQEIEVIRDPL